MGFGGGNGGGSIASASDTALNNPADGQGLVYEASLSKWQNTAVYAKPASGIPESDLTETVVDKLNAGDPSGAISTRVKNNLTSLSLTPPKRWNT